MHRHLWLIAGTALAVTIVATTATATTNVARSAHAADATPAAAPFAQSWANVPRTTAARKAKDILVFGQEQDIVGFNTALTCCNQFWAGVQTRAGHPRRVHHRTTSSSTSRTSSSDAKATKTTLSYTIRPDANWNWGGKKIPVTYKDFVYTWQQIVDPKNDLVGRDGYDQITGFTHKGHKQITFKWKKPYAAWQDLFGGIYPSAALAGMDFNKIWTNCICGNDGKPVSDGPLPADELHEGPGLDAEGQPVLVRQEAGHQRGRLQAHHRHEHRGSGHARRRGRRDQPDLRRRTCSR